MPKPKNYLWICPTCSKGKKAPSRLRKVDVRRYCLKCSEKAGVLVERSIPKLDKKRDVKRVKSQAKSAVKAKAKREKERPARERDRELRKKARELSEWRARLTEHVNSRPDKTVYGHTPRQTCDAYRKMGCTVVAWSSGYYVPQWAIELRNVATSDAGGMDAARLLARFVFSRPELESALIAVCAVDSRRVWPYIVGQYVMPLSKAIRHRARSIQAEIYGIHFDDADPTALGFARKQVA